MITEKNLEVLKERIKKLKRKEEERQKDILHAFLGMALLGFLVGFIVVDSYLDGRSNEKPVHANITPRR